MLASSPIFLNLATLPRHGGRQARKEVWPRPEALPLRLHSFPQLVGRQTNLGDVVFRKLLRHPRPDALDYI